MVERAYEDGQQARRDGKPYEHPWSGGAHSPANNFRRPVIDAWEQGYRDEIVAEKRNATLIGQEIIGEIDSEDRP